MIARVLPGLVFLVVLLLGSAVGGTSVDVARAAPPAAAAPLPPAPAKNDQLANDVFEVLWRTPASELDRNENGSARWTRLYQVARAISAAARKTKFYSPLTPAAALAALGQHESTWALYIGEDRCGDGPVGMRCDPDEKGEPRARGYWQLHRAACPEIWKHAPSAERLMLEADCAANVFARAADRCFAKTTKGIIATGLAGYRGKCDASDAELRAQTWNVFLGVLEDGWPEAPPEWARRKGRRTAQEGRQARALLEQPVGTWVVLEPGKLGALVEWHFHDFGGEARPRGWHRGVSFFAPKGKR